MKDDTKSKKFLTVRCAHFGAPIENLIKINKRTLLPLKGEVSGFHNEVKKLTRPYIVINASDHKKLEDGSSDYYLLKSGQVVTFGNADGGYALMPLQQKYASDVLNKNGIFF